MIMCLRYDKYRPWVAKVSPNGLIFLNPLKDVFSCWTNWRQGKRSDTVSFDIREDGKYVKKEDGVKKTFWVKKGEICNEAV